jgi:hypothetical protein
LFHWPIKRDVWVSPNMVDDPLMDFQSRGT